MSYYQNGTGNGVANMRKEEKRDMVHLNDKLASYMQKVRSLGSGGGDSQAFLDAMRSIEDEVNRLKRMYESELDALRRKLDESNRQKNDAISEGEKYRRQAADMEDRFRAEAEKTAAMMNDIRKLQARIAELERELAAARAAVNGPQSQVAGLQNDLAKECARGQELARQLDAEKNRNKQLEDKIKAQEQKSGFNDKRNDEQLKDANNRLDQSKKVINDLESRARDLERQNATLPEMLEKMRQKTDQDLQNYKKEMDENNKKNNVAMKKQLDDQARDLQKLRDRNSRLEKENADLANRVRSLEGQVRDLENQKACLESQLQQERNRSADQVRALEQKLKDLQDSLFAKMQEVNMGKDAQVSLRAEIEAYRALLEEEDRRLGNLANRKSGGLPTGTPYAVPRSPCVSPRNKIDVSTPPRAQGPRVPVTNTNNLRTEYQFAYNKGGPVPAWARTRTSVDTFPKLNTDKRSETPRVRQSMQRAY